MNKLSDTVIVDRLGDLRAMYLSVDAMYENLKMILVKRCRRRNRAFDGKRYRATISFSTDLKTFSLEKARKYMTEDQIKKCMVPAKDRNQLRVYALPKKLRDNKS